ncbi:hypothetical protein PRZ48_012101 [Zasmidium cellare]|uniref:Uncharacterized protein n=1 Tax=Zasmidium cellare TaxID=395010 RepID=A0ABR0E3W4_ZASCE|nr:hypothetical protein PRZ48_012101 [Zasmidium cellare]
MDSSNTNEFLAARLEALCGRSCQGVDNQDFHSSSHMTPTYRAQVPWISPLLSPDQSQPLQSLTLDESLHVQKDLVAKYPEYKLRIVDMATVVDAKCSTGEAEVFINFHFEGFRLKS